MTESVGINADRPVTFAGALVAPVTVKRAIKVSLVVGSILTLINQSDHMMTGEMPPAWKIILTYLVPYCVSSYSTAALMKDFFRGGRKAYERSTS